MIGCRILPNISRVMTLLSTHDSGRHNVKELLYLCCSALPIFFSEEASLERLSELVRLHRIVKVINGARTRSLFTLYQ